MSAKHDFLKMTGGREGVVRRRLEKAAGDSEINKTVVEDALGADDWENYLSDVVHHGCSSGVVPGMIYYHETCAWYDRLKDEIWEMLYEEAQSQGGSIMQLIAGLNGADSVGGDDQLKNLLAWYAYETAANRIIMALESEDE